MRKMISEESSALHGKRSDTPCEIPRDLAHMILCGAVRYYVGRGTISSRAVARGIGELLPQLGDATKGAIARSIRWWLDAWATVDGARIDDAAPWDDLLTAIEESSC